MRQLWSLLLVLALAPVGRAGAQATGQVTGTVTDAGGTVLAGAAVTVQGTGRGTLTGADGRFTVTGVPTGTHTVRATRLGYGEASRSVSVAAGQTVTVSLQLAAQALELEGVVAVGYGTQRRRDVTGAVGSVNVEEAETGVQNNVAQMLAGRVPGVQVTQASGEPGGGSTVRIRGANSINASNEPLYVIDGLPIDNGSITPGGPIFNTRPRNPLNALSPDDIASIEVLKDASATAIYGSRGANGVIIVTTKSGRRGGGVEIDYEGYVGTQSAVRRLDMLGTQDYIALMNDLRRDQGQPAEFTAEQIAAIGAGTDWQDQVFRTAPVTSHHLGFSGGGEDSRFYASLGVMDQEGVVVSSGTKRYTARANVEQNNDRIRLGLNLNASYINDDLVPLGTNVNEQAGVVASAIYQDPTLPIRADNGKYAQSPFVNVENPLGLAQGVNDFSETNRTFGNAFLEYTLLPGLVGKANLGADRQSARRDFYMNSLTKRGTEQSGLAQVSALNRQSYLAEFTLNFNREVGEAHRFDLLGGYTYQNFSSNSLLSNAEGFTSDAFETNNLSAGLRDTWNVGSGRARNQLLSYLGRLNYSLLDRYLLTATFRADGSSRFGADSKFGYFPSVAVGWRVLDEPFLRDQTLFSDLKLRVSYGLTGNQEIGNYNSLVLLGVRGTAWFDEGANVGIAPTQIANPDLKWETTRQFDAGFDFGILDNRISGAFDYFVKNTTDLLLNLPIPSTTGFSTVLSNVGGVRNEGVELSITTENLSGPLSWTTSLNASAVRNEVTDLAGLPNIIQGNAGFTRDFTILREGDPLNAYYGYVVEGVWQTGDNIAGSAQPRSRPGEFRFRDGNGDGKITPDDREILGSPFPDFTIGLNNAFNFGPFDLSAFLQGNFGAELLNLNQIESENPISFRRNRLRESYTNRWTPSNPTNEFNSGIPPVVAYGGIVNSRAVEGADFVRLKNVELRYTLPSAGPLRSLRNASVYVSGQNLVTWTDYSGYDPEVSSFGESNLRVDYSAYPTARTLTAGVRVGL